MAHKIRRYETAGVVVTYDVKRCIHVEECVHGNAEVFNRERRPWIDPSQATPDEIADVVVNCPTGALYFERRDGGEEEQPPQENVMRLAEDGPLYVHGRVKLTLPGEGDPVNETRLALCRCGASKNKPFCDNSHLETEFKDAGMLGDGRLGEVETEGEDLEISLVPNGPILIRGSLRLLDAAGEQPMEGTKGALCRCGASQHKPYCDGSHTAIGFEAD